MAELKAVLTANIDKLERELAKAKKELLATENVAESTQKKLSQVGGKKAANQINSYKKATANALPTAQEFSRVIQDAPFGIQGVGNNIQQLAGNFTNLTRQAGGALPALKLVGTSLISGPGALIFGVSAVTSLLTVFGDELFGVGEKAKSTDKDVKSLSDTINEYGKRLIGINKANFNATSKIAEQSTRLKQLQRVVRDTAESQKTRLSAVNELQNTYPSYFGNLSKEDILNKDLVDTYDKVAKSIQKKAKALAATNLLTDIAEKELKIQQEIEGIDKNRISSQNTLNQLRNAETNSLQKQSSFASNVSKILEKDKERKGELEAQLGLLESQRNELLKIAGIDFESNSGGKSGGVEVTRIGFDKKPLNEVFKLTESGLESLTKKFNNAPFRTGFFNAFVQPLDDGLKRIKPGLANIELALQEFNTNAGAIIQEGLVSTFAGIGDAIGSAVADGGNVLNALSKTLLSSLGGVLVELGQMAIAVGVGIKGVKAALKTLNPVAAIAAGVGLVAIGSAFRAGASRLGDSNGSSAVSGQGSRSFSGNNSSTFSSSGLGSGTVVFEIHGKKLIGVLNNNLSANHRLGGNLGIGEWRSSIG